MPSASLMEALVGIVLKQPEYLGVMCEEAPLSRIQSCSSIELVDAAAMKAQLQGYRVEEESGDEDGRDIFNDLWR